MASLTFPSSPSNGDTYTYDGLIYVYNSTKNKWSVQSTTTITDVQADSISTSLSPSANVTYDLGTSEKSFRDLYLSGSTIHLGSQQISSNSTGVILPEGSLVGTSEIGSGSGVTVYANASILPTSGLTSGEMAYTGNAIFITNGSGWYRVAVTNQNPALTMSTGSISLGSSGNTVFFTYTVSDPDGTTPTVTLSNSGIANTSVANVNLYTANNTVRIDNFSATEWSGTITLTASDGISTGFDSLTVDVSYLSQYWDETVLSVGTSSTNSLDNSTFIDRSTNAHTVTPTGSPSQTAFHPYLDYYSVYLDGSSYYSVSMSADWQFNTGDYTAEIWVKPDDTSTGQIFGVWSDTNASNQMWLIQQTSAGYKHWLDPADTVINQSAASAVVPGKWIHLAITRSGDTFRLFVDGTKVSEATSTNYNMNESGGFLGIGRAENGTYFKGHIADAHVIKGYAKYTSDFTVPTEPVTAHANTKFLAFRKNRIYDESSSSHSIGINGSPKVVAANPFGQLSQYTLGENKGSATFPTTGTKLELGEDPLFAFGTGDYTVEFWYYSNPSSGGTIYGTVFDTSTGAAYLGSLFITASPTAGQTLIVYQNGGTRASGTTSGKNLQAGEWTHCAVTRESGTINIWINGVLDGTGSGTDDLTLSDATIGGTTYWAGSYDMRDGDIISDLKVTKGTAVYTSTFTPPTSPIGNTNASLYLPMDNAGIYDKTGTNTIILGGDTSTSTTQTKYASTSIKFDGTGDTAYIAGGASHKFNIGGITQWTAEFWCNTTAAGHQRLLTFHGPQNWGLIKPVAQTTGIEWNHFGPGAAFTSGAGTLPANTWTHVALVRNGSTITCYLNGTSAGSTTSMPTSGAYEVWIGSSTGTYARSDTNGYFENVQFLSGIAKYTSNFTPPTQTQGRTYQASS